MVQQKLNLPYQFDSLGFSSYGYSHKDIYTAVYNGVAGEECITYAVSVQVMSQYQVE